MSEFKHTPGPWSVKDASFDEDGDVRYTLEGVKTARVADANLIDAAPDLLEACQALLTYHDSADDDGVQMMLAYSKAIDQARAAIAKATGATK